MTERPSYAEFLSRWRSERIVALGTDGVKPSDRDHIAEARARELTELAIRNGYRADLADASRPYRSVTEYVKALYDSAEHKAKS